MVLSGKYFSEFRIMAYNVITVNLKSYKKLVTEYELKFSSFGDTTGYTYFVGTRAYSLGFLSLGSRVGDFSTSVTTAIHDRVFASGGSLISTSLPLNLVDYQFKPKQFVYWVDSSVVSGNSVGLRDSTGYVYGTGPIVFGSPKLYDCYNSKYGNGFVFFVVGGTPNIFEVEMYGTIARKDYKPFSVPTYNEGLLDYLSDSSLSNSSSSLLPVVYTESALTSSSNYTVQRLNISASYSALRDSSTNFYVLNPTTTGLDFVLPQNPYKYQYLKVANVSNVAGRNVSLKEISGGVTIKSLSTIGSVDDKTAECLWNGTTWLVTTY